MMELKAGYKQTEVGVIPEDWKVKKIVDVAPLQRGFDLPSTQLKQGFYPVIYSNGILNYHCEYKAKGQGVITGRSGTIGKVTFINENYYPHNTTLWVTNFKGNEPKFIYYLYSYIGFERFSTGSGVPTLNRNDVHIFQVPLPTKTEQTAIATALSDTDALINALDKLIAKKRLIKQGAMQQLLSGKKRLAGFSGEWEVKKLGGVANLINGRAYKLTEWETQGTPVIRLQNLTGSDNYYFSQLNLPAHQYCNFGDLLYMWSATFGTHIWKGGKAIYHYHIWKVEPIKGFSDKNFLFHKFNEITESLKQKSTNGGTMLHITKSFMENNEILFPPIEEQTAIAQILSDMDNEIAALEKRRAKTQHIKHGMMQELLTGKTRLINPTHLGKQP